MSAWLVSKIHIDALVTAMVGWEIILPDQVEAIGKLLWIENIRSLEARYPAGPDRPWAGPEHEESRAEAGKYTDRFGSIEGWDSHLWGTDDRDVFLKAEAVRAEAKGVQV